MSDTPTSSPRRTNIASTTAGDGTQYFVTLVEDGEHTSMLSLGKRGADGTETVLHADTALFPLPLTVALAQDVALSLASQMIRSELPPGADVNAAAWRMILGQSSGRDVEERGIFDFLFGGHDRPADSGSLNDRLHDTARDQVGALDSGNAPDTNNGRRACVWAVNQIHIKATGRRLTSTLATAVLIDELRGGLGDEVNVGDLQPGDLVISPTEGERTGHVGYVGTGEGDDRLIYSNSSSHHVWQQNYTVGSWREDIANARKLIMKFYRLRAPAAPRSLPEISFPRLAPVPVSMLPTVSRNPKPRNAGGRGLSLDSIIENDSDQPSPVSPSPSVVDVPAGDRSIAHLAGIYRALGVTPESIRSSRALGTRGLFDWSSGGRWLVAEGDSWFDYSYPQPSPSIIGRDLIDGLRDFGHDVENVGTAGATVQDMAFGPDNDSIFDFFNRDDTQLFETVKWVLRRRPRAFLLSGGGNDFAGDGFEDYLNPAGGGNPGLHQANVERLMTSVIEPAYRHIISVVKKAAADHGIHDDLPVFLHGYANAFPDGRRHMIGVGPWLSPGFEKRGYLYDKDSPSGPNQLAIRRQIVTALLERFRASLRRIAIEFGNVHIADFTGELGRNEDWQNELHPTNSGFRTIAGIMNRLIENSLGPMPVRALQTTELMSDADRAAEASLISEFDHARLSFEADDLHGALAWLRVAESRRADDTSATNAALAVLPPQVAARDQARWLNLGNALAGLLHHSPAATQPSPSASHGSAALDYESLKPGYEQLWSSISLRPEKQVSIRQMTDLVLAGRAEYQALQTDLGVPWYFTGIIHALEGSCRFSTHLHNGDPLTARTVNEPAGRPVAGHPPFSWRESARDALMMKGYHSATDWSVSAMLWRWERYNGFGYRRASVNIPSPYLWSFSTHYVKGKYTSDGHYDPEAVSKQVGAAVLLKALILRGEVTL